MKLTLKTQPPTNAYLDKLYPLLRQPCLPGVEGIRQDVANLRKTFTVFREGKPLKVGIRNELRELTGWSSKRLTRALRYHTRGFAYLRSVAKRAGRFDLKNRLVGPVDEEHAAEAADLLAVLDDPSKRRPKAKRKKGG